MHRLRNRTRRHIHVRLRRSGPACFCMRRQSKCTKQCIVVRHHSPTSYHVALSMGSQALRRTKEHGFYNTPRSQNTIQIDPISIHSRGAPPKHPHLTQLENAVPESGARSSGCHRPIADTSVGSDCDSDREMPSGSQDWHTPLPA